MKALRESLARVATLAQERKLLNLELDSIEADPENPRREFDQEALDGLAASIKAQGLIEPIVVRPVGHGRFMITAGERRWRAARIAGLARVPCITEERDDNRPLVRLVENIQRADLTPWEVAQALRAHYGDLQRGDVSRIADELGMSAAWVSRHFALLELTPGLQVIAQTRRDVGVQRLIAMSKMDAATLGRELDALDASPALEAPPTPTPAADASAPPPSGPAPAGGGEGNFAGGKIDTGGPLGRVPGGDPSADGEAPPVIREAFDGLAERLGVRCALKAGKRHYTVQMQLSEAELLDLAERAAAIPLSKRAMAARCEAIFREHGDAIRQRVADGEKPSAVAAWLKTEYGFPGSGATLNSFLR
jgi:ParB/RepB/Spo0J family partition protein